MSSRVYNRFNRLFILSDSPSLQRVNQSNSAYDDSQMAIFDLIYVNKTLSAVSIMAITVFEL